MSLCDKPTSQISYMYKSVSFLLNQQVIDRVFHLVQQIQIVLIMHINSHVLKLCNYHSSVVFMVIIPGMLPKVIDELSRLLV